MAWRSPGRGAAGATVEERWTSAVLQRHLGRRRDASPWPRRRPRRPRRGVHGRCAGRCPASRGPRWGRWSPGWSPRPAWPARRGPWCLIDAPAADQLSSTCAVARRARLFRVGQEEERPEGERARSNASTSSCTRSTPSGISEPKVPLRVSSSSGLFGRLAGWGKIRISRGYGTRHPFAHSRSTPVVVLEWALAAQLDATKNEVLQISDANTVILSTSRVRLANLRAVDPHSSCGYHMSST